MHFVLLVDGVWGAWRSWGSCSATCGTGQRSRSRPCDSPTPLHGGKHCPGPANATENCNEDPCPGEMEVLHLHNHCLVSFIQRT